MADDFRSADIDEPTRALLEYCVKLTRTPWLLAAADLDELRRHGFDDRAIHEAVQIAGYFNYINRVCDALGVEPEDFMPPRPAGWDRRTRREDATE